MKRFILCLFLFALPLAAQPNNPSVTYVGSAPSGSCSQAPPVQVLNSSGAIYTCDNGTWAVQGGGGSGTVGAGTAGQYARYLANGTTVAGESGTSILVTDPPYNCKCDGSTDDHVCLQASFDSGSGIVNLPVSAGASQFLCATSVPLTFIKSTVLEMNSSGIYFTGNSGYGLTTGGIQTVENGYFQTNSSTGTFGALNLGVDSIVLNVNIFDLLTPPLTYTAIFENNISLTTLIAVSTDGPVVLSSASNPYQYGTSIIDSNFGPATQAFPALLVVGASIPVFNLSSVSIDINSHSIVS